jgi:hypothetical protein
MTSTIKVNISSKKDFIIRPIVHNYQAPVVLIADINWYSDAALSPDSLAATSLQPASPILHLYQS